MSRKVKRCVTREEKTKQNKTSHPNNPISVEETERDNEQSDGSTTPT